MIKDFKLIVEVQGLLCHSDRSDYCIEGKFHYFSWKKFWEVLF